jgi:hypothetical protein
MFIILSMPPIKVYVVSVSNGDNFKTVNIIMEAVYEEYYYKRAYSKAN